MNFDKKSFKSLRNKVFTFLFLKIKALLLIHKKVLSKSTYYSQFWISWYMILVSFVILLPETIFSFTFHFLYTDLNIDKNTIGLILLVSALFQLFSMTSETRIHKKIAAKLCFGLGIFMSLMFIPALINGTVGFGIFVFPFYAFHELRILVDLCKNPKSFNDNLREDSNYGHGKYT